MDIRSFIDVIMTDSLFKVYTLADLETEHDPFDEEIISYIYKDNHFKAAIPNFHDKVKITRNHAVKYLSNKKKLFLSIVATNKYLPI